MLDLSPEKMMALMVIGLVVLGPQRLPQAARALARGLARARRLAEALTQPLQETLSEPRRSVEAAMAEVRGAIGVPAGAIGSTGQAPRQATAGRLDVAGLGARPEEIGPHDFDPMSN